MHAHLQVSLFLLIRNLLLCFAYNFICQDFACTNSTHSYILGPECTHIKHFYNLGSACKLLYSKYPDEYTKQF